MAQMKNVHGVELHFENVPFRLRGVIGDLFVEDLEDTINAYGAYVLGPYKRKPPDAVFRRYFGVGFDQYMADRSLEFFKDWNYGRHIVRYGTDKHGNIVGYSPLLNDSKIWVTGRLQ